jgi:acyl-CoA synthetase (AMP-forming)/AMP-acid ligase II
LLTFVRACVTSQALVQPGLLLVGSTDGACAAVACECCSRLDVPVLSLADDPLTSRNKAGVAAHECGVALPAPNPTAHIIFTSGSSGDPKAVFCHHRGSLLSHASRIAAIERCEKSASAPTSLHDDTDISATNKHVQQSAFGCGVFGVWDAVAAHFCGDIAVMLPDKALRDAEQLAALLAVNNVDRMLITPTCKLSRQHVDGTIVGTDKALALTRSSWPLRDLSVLDNLLSNAAACAGLGLLRSITLCGELPSASLVARAVALLPPNTALVNLYSSCVVSEAGSFCCWVLLCCFTP